jgi:hypothetical protein
VRLVYQYHHLTAQCISIYQLLLERLTGCDNAQITGDDIDNLVA